MNPMSIESDCGKAEEVAGVWGECARLPFLTEANVVEGRLRSFKRSRTLTKEYVVPHRFDRQLAPDGICAFDIGEDQAPTVTVLLFDDAQ